jgi:hypothetical protein
MRRAVIAAGVIVAVLVAAQVALPPLAEQRLRSDLERHGSGVRAQVSAFPAITLLWHRADRVTVTVADYRPGPPGSGASLADELAGTKATGDLDVRIGTLDDRLLRMHDVTLRKRGDELTAQVRLRRSEVDAALPPQLHVTGQAGSGDQIAVAGETTAFGRRIAARARIRVDSRGRLVLEPGPFPLAALVSIPLFADDRVAVDTIDARPAPGGFTVTARGHLRG